MVTTIFKSRVLPALWSTSRVCMFDQGGLAGFDTSIFEGAEVKLCPNWLIGGCMVMGVIKICVIIPFQVSNPARPSANHDFKLSRPSF